MTNKKTPRFYKDPDGPAFCDISCPYLYLKGKYLNAVCNKDHKDINFYDWHLAHCEESKEESYNE
jgi:hypothetical protein